METWERAIFNAIYILQLLHIIRNIVTLINPQTNLISPQVMYFHIIHRVVRKKLANLMRIERFQLKNKLFPYVIKIYFPSQPNVCLIYL